ncbi:hypothetical protein D3C81_456520 [compost metagenome]
MRWLLLVTFVSSIAACGMASEAPAREIACMRLNALPEGPTLKGPALCSALEVSAHKGGIFLAEFHDKQQNKLWAVTVSGSGESEISTMAANE